MFFELLLVIGDFNIYVNVFNDLDVVCFLELLILMGFEQYVDRFMYIFGYMLDLIIICCLDFLFFVKFVVDYLFFDYVIVLCDFELGKLFLKVK